MQKQTQANRAREIRCDALLANKKYATWGNRTPLCCLEGNNADHYTKAALWTFCLLA